MFSQHIHTRQSTGSIFVGGHPMSCRPSFYCDKIKLPKQPPRGWCSPIENHGRMGSRLQSRLWAQIPGPSSLSSCVALVGSLNSLHLIFKMERTSFFSLRLLKASVGYNTNWVPGPECLHVSPVIRTSSAAWLACSGPWLLGVSCLLRDKGSVLCSAGPAVGAGFLWDTALFSRTLFPYLFPSERGSKHEGLESLKGSMGILRALYGLQETDQFTEVGKSWFL